MTGPEGIQNCMETLDERVFKYSICHYLEYVASLYDPIICQKPGLEAIQVPQIPPPFSKFQSSKEQQKGPLPLPRRIAKLY